MLSGTAYVTLPDKITGAAAVVARDTLCMPFAALQFENNGYMSRSFGYKSVFSSDAVCNIMLKLTT